MEASTPLAPGQGRSPLDLPHRVAVERSMIIARWCGVAFGIFQIATYGAQAYPPGVELRAYLLIGLLAAGNVIATVVNREVASEGAARWLGVATFALDILVVSSFVWLYSFDDGSVFFLLFFVLPAEGALKFRMSGALAAWAVCTAVYVGRDFYAAERFGYAVNMPSSGYRMGFLLIVALVFGMLARRLAERTGELENALRSLEAVARWRTALIDTLAHDLRSPIGTAVSALEILGSEAHRELDPEQAEMLTQSALRQSRRALHLTDDLLALARAREGDLVDRLDEVELDGIVHQVVGELDDGTTEVTVDVDPELRVRADPRCLERILANLISNASKHGRPPVSLTAEVDGDDVVIRVTDHGEGVSDDMQATLFEPFTVGTRADSVGLGLWVVRQLAEGQGGRAGYATRGGLPSFEVAFPVTPDPLPGEGPEVRPQIDA